MGNCRQPETNFRQKSDWL